MLKVLSRIRKSRQVGPPSSSRKDSEPPTNRPSDDDEEPPAMQPLSATSLEVNDHLSSRPPAAIVITGGGIVGLLMALALDKHLHVKAEIYEQAEGYAPDVGAGMGLYANGLRVLRDIDPRLLREIQRAGQPYVYRRWERHDGTEVAVAEESVLGSIPNDDNDDDSTQQPPLQTMGIRRWKLQQCLHAAVERAGIPLFFGKRVATVTTPADGTTEVLFVDGSRRRAQLLIAADGGRSVVRSASLHRQAGDAADLPTLHFTGVTCIMGVAEHCDDVRQGISLPVSPTTNCHGAFYPTGSNEQCFQFHFPHRPKDSCEASGNNELCWGALSETVSREECQKLAAILRDDGWDEEKYVKPLQNVTKAVKVGFSTLAPALTHWSFPNAQGQPRTILVGDAAHPPVPYIGQGAQQGMEDVGTLALLLKAFCLDDHGNLDLHDLNYAVKVYERLRIPRVEAMLNNGKMVGTMQQKRAQNAAYNIIKEETIQREVFFHETLSIMLPGAQYDYRAVLEKELEQMPKRHNLPPLRPIAEDS